jgi:hypothetical protein
MNLKPHLVPYDRGQVFGPRHTRGNIVPDKPHRDVIEVSIGVPTHEPQPPRKIRTRWRHLDLSQLVFKLVHQCRLQDDASIIPANAQLPLHVCEYVCSSPGSCDSLPFRMKFEDQSALMVVEFSDFVV